MVVMIFLIVTIPIAFISPTTGILYDKPLIPLFYTAIVGISIIIIYSSYKDRKQRQKDRINRRSKK
jgi:hypothetical protein